MARKGHLFLYRILTFLKSSILTLKNLLSDRQIGKRSFKYLLIACLSLWLCILELPGIAFSTSEIIANGLRPNIKLTQNLLTSSSYLPETHVPIPFNKGIRGDETQTETLEQQAKTLYETGRYAEAAQLLEQALHDYQKRGDIITQAVILSNLALSYQQLGTWDKAAPAIEQALNLLKQAPKDTPSRSAVWAQALDVLASLQLAEGKTEKAVDSWEQSAQLYNQLGDSTRATRSRINQAQALQALGLYRQAIFTLNSVKKDLQSEPDSLAKAENLRSLGDALRGIGNLECNQEKSQSSSDCVGATEVLQESLEIAKQLQSPAAIAAANLSLGNVAVAQSRLASEQGKNNAAQRQTANQMTQNALDFYQQAMAMPIPAIQTQAQLNYLRLLVELEQWSEAEKLYPEVQQQIENLPPGRSQIYAQVNLAISLRKISTRKETIGSLTTPSFQEIDQILTAARQEAELLQDVRSQALVLEEQGQLYQKTQQLPVARMLSQQTLNLSQSIQASEISYRAAWQLGRILKAQAKDNEQQGNITQAQENYQAAIAAYTTAYEELKSVRSDLLAASADVQFSFRKSVEPVYRELVDLLLQLSPEEIASSQNKQDKPPQPTSAKIESSLEKQKKLKKAREVLEALQVAELQNYFQQACEDVKLELDQVVEQGEQTGQKAAVIYPIILDDRLEVILKLPNEKDLYQYPPLKLSRNQIEKRLHEFQNNLRDEYKFKGVRESGQVIYNWLIEPVSQLLERSGVHTLIFIQDGPLRTTPMSALYDGNQFLVEKYAVVLVLGLEVRDPTPLDRSNLHVLAAGLTDPPEQFEQYGKLPYVNLELNEIKNSGVSVALLQDHNFTKEAFNKTLNQDNFQVVHLATHGQFGADPNSTYILTADGEIKLNQLDEMFRILRGIQTKEVDLLVLSACKTATGSDRAVLGIAGTTVRAGAKSAIAGLWSLADSSSVEFSEKVYQNLGKPNITRAEALRQAQLGLLNDRRYTHPRYWAPYVLVGSWL
ncbi:MAG TPA: hypothetical protein DDZ80_22155 [Cyanobacteria bacterium UBA8803]|nr:hypothetical protein [Cyanobacteria bacterium UBA9273]HBL61033.1 hypothetical protein [Cyanobacteria bacterium UBA8803]